MLKFLGGTRTTETKVISTTLLNSGLKNIFNPSVTVVDTGFALSFRALPTEGVKPFHAYFLEFSSDGSLTDGIVDLTDRFSEKIRYPVADPKLCRLSGETWITFNSGHFEKPNNLYLARIRRNGDQLFRVDYPERAEIEKNWAFFMHDSVLHALYSLDPLVILREVRRSDGVISFTELQDEAYGVPAEEKLRSRQSAPVITIGSQLADLNDAGQDFAFMGHRRFYWKGKRLYVGKPLRLTFGEGRFFLTQGDSFFAHSLSSLFGSRIKHNPKLLSCTYFSGLAVLQNRLLVSYGINDTDFGLACLPTNAWPSPADESKQSQQ